MLTALKAGYATMSTDNGHVTDPNAPNGGSEQSWALGHPEKMIDFAYRALHVSTVAAKTDRAAISMAGKPANPISWAVRRAAITP